MIHASHNQQCMQVPSCVLKQGSLVGMLVQPGMLPLSVMWCQQLTFANCTQVRTRTW
jgi:hypothetical protein